jgi:hypothetical protein
MALAACTSPRREVPPMVARSATAAVEAHCGRCHRPDQPTALPRALAVFDLSHARWWEDPPDRALPHLATRMETLAGGHAPETGEDDLAIFGGAASQAEVDAVRLLVEAERARRGLSR